MPQNYFRAAFQKYFSPGATIEEIYYLYLAIYVGGLMVIEYGNYMHVLTI